ncbi:MAG: cbb3-type cytochrome c oxidase subunit 3 [Hyphomicrobium sp.]
MDGLTYDTVASFCMVASLLLFISLFVFVLVYVFRFASRDRLEQVQRDALDLGPDNSKLRGRT